MTTRRLEPLPLLLLFLQVLLLMQIQLPMAIGSYHPLVAGTITNHTTTTTIVTRCPPDQASALLRLKLSFFTTNESIATFRSWRDDNFNRSKIPPGLERLTQLTHLNLSNSNFAGQVPSYNIGRLTNLVSLDLSFFSEITEFINYGFTFSDYTGRLFLHNLTALVANLTSLRELQLGWVDLSNQGEEWCNALAKHTPNLRLLSLPFCFLSSPICGSLARLHSLSVVDLHANGLTGPVPEFFANFSSLSVLQLSYNHFDGRVPSAIFQHKKLVTIDLHVNYYISGNLPNFSTDTSQENLFLGRTDFSGAIPNSISNLKSLKKLGLDAFGFAGELPSSIGELRSLSSLKISGLGLVGSFSSWITNLTSLEVLEFSIGDLNKLRKLALFSCNFVGKIPPGC